jgi:hypothetical protein
MVVTHSHGWQAQARLEITFEGYPYVRLVADILFFLFFGGLHAKEGHLYDMPAAMRAFQAHDL